MSEEVSEIIRVLQLTTYDEDEWDSDNLTVMRKNMGIIEGKMASAHDWLNDPHAMQGRVISFVLFWYADFKNEF